MFVCTLIASTLVLTPVSKATHNSVFYFGDVIGYENRNVWTVGTKLSQRVLNRSICKKIEQVEPFIGPDGTVHELASEVQCREARQRMVSEHCQRRLMAEGISNPAEHCGAGLNR